MSKNILYASDLDRTLIFSKRFIEEYPTDAKYTAIEYKGPEIISYIADEVKNKLNLIRSIDNIKFIPVTTRSINEYNRVNLGFVPEYAIVANGAVILHNGKPIEEWSQYIKDGINPVEVLDLAQDIYDLLHSVHYNPRLIDGGYIFFKTDNTKLYDIEIAQLIDKYSNWSFTRQVNKCYAIPKHFSKQIALRWLWNKLGKPFIVASGDSELDLPMLTLADKAIIPEHGTLVKEGFVEGGTFTSGGITSPLYTMDLVLEEASK